MQEALAKKSVLWSRTVAVENAWKHSVNKEKPVSAKFQNPNAGRNSIVEAASSVAAT